MNLGLNLFKIASSGSERQRSAWKEKANFFLFIPTLNLTNAINLSNAPAWFSGYSESQISCFPQFCI